MKKRLIDCTARELAAYTKEDLLRRSPRVRAAYLPLKRLERLHPCL